jgi:hypothetical protein
MNLGQVLDKTQLLFLDTAHPSLATFSSKMRGRRQTLTYADPLI